jgi:alginate O-acetyltransferase complex protein AlgI
MLFNSYEFILVFLPIAVLGFAFAAKFGHRFAIWWLTIASIAFYSYWNLTFLPVLLLSILFNYTMGWAILTAGPQASRRILIAGLAGNLLALAYFKYAAFLVGTLDALAGLSLPLPHVVLPLGVSFFTFTQIAFLVDAHQRRLATERGLASYALFVSYFPHLIAGPILHHKQMLSQFGEAGRVRLASMGWTIGCTLFAIGLAKKVLLADPLGGYVTPVFDLAKGGMTPSFVAAWAAALSFTFQLYFDFSGYSDMAVGLSRLFGIQIPVNFNSPYRSINIVEFWRRWHISLSTFLRDYLYIPLGGNRRGAMRRYVNLMITMILGGLWHGANWTFVAWGALHGLYLLINHAWRAIPGTRNENGPSLPGRLLGGAVTFLAVAIAWVFFRAEDFPTALRILSGMAAFDAVPLLSRAAFMSDQILMPLGTGMLWLLLALSAAIAFLFPNSNDICAAVSNAIEARSQGLARPLLVSTAVAFGILLGVGIVSIGRATQFLYFQF